MIKNRIKFGLEAMKFRLGFYERRNWLGEGVLEILREDINSIISFIDSD